MVPRKREAPAEDASLAEPLAKRRSSRQANASLTRSESAKKETLPGKSQKKAVTNKKAVNTEQETKKAKATGSTKSDNTNSEPKRQETTDGPPSSRAISEDPDVGSIPAVNPEAPRHEGEWYWLMKAEPESRFENGIDVRFSIDDLRAKDKPEGWDGIRAYAARNHMRNMNVGDKAFFYHSNCKEPGIVGIMEIVKEFSEDRSARRPGTPYYDPSSSKEKQRWSLVHVEFRKKFAVPIYLKELRELGQGGGPLEQMQMLKQSRLSVSRVSAEEWKALCEVADEKANEAGMKHQE